MSAALRSGALFPDPAPDGGRDHARRIVEALLFAASEPLSLADLQSRLPGSPDIRGILSELARWYAGRGVNLVETGGRWALRTAPDLADALTPAAGEPQKLSRAALEILAIIAYHQPVTRAQMEDIRGVTTSKGTLDLLLETGWIRPKGRRQAPGRPVLYGTTPAFLDHFGLAAIADLPGLDELKGLGLIDRPITSDPATSRSLRDALRTEDDGVLDQEPDSD